jgi:hypothetical protein
VLKVNQPYTQGGTKRAAVAAPLPGNFSEKTLLAGNFNRTIHARKFGVDKSGNIRRKLRSKQEIIRRIKLLYKRYSCSHNRTNFNPLLSFIGIIINNI